MQRELEPEVMDTAEDATGYDAMDHTAPNRAFVERLKSLGAGGTMIDLGTGPGQIPIMVAIERITPEEIIAVDLSPHMLDIARQKHASVGHYNMPALHIRFELADVKKLPYPDRSFDTVFSNTILHHIPRPVEFLREAWRVLKPKGVLLIRDLYRPPDEKTLDHLVALHAAGCDAHQTKMFRDSLKAALTPEELRATAREAGMRGVEVVIDTDRHMSLQRARAS